MKKMLLPLVMLVAISNTAQVVPAAEKYRTRAKRQQSAGVGLIVLGAGFLVLGAVLIGSNDPQSNLIDFSNRTKGIVCLVAGGASASTGIVLLTASARNKRNAASISLRPETSFAPSYLGVQFRRIPALQLRLCLEKD